MSAIALLGNFNDFFFVIIYMCFQESRNHLFPAMFARLYLMKAVQQVSSMYLMTHCADPYYLKMLVVLLFGATCTICNVLRGWSRGQNNEQQNNVPSPKRQCSCRLSGPSENRAFKGCRSTVLVYLQI